VSKAPLVEALVRAGRTARVRACVPGHGGGPLVPEPLQWALAQVPLWSLDLTELPGLDDLAWPSGPIQEAESALARFVGAQGAAMLVGGSTAGILASLWALLPPGGTVAFPSGSHRSLYAGAALAGAQPMLLAETIDPDTGYSLGPAPDERERVRQARPPVVVLTAPTYQGVAVDVREWAQIVHEYGGTLVVDAAHGAHLGIHPLLPPSALSQGADVVVLGLHKSWGSLTQTAALVWREAGMGEHLRRFLRLLQSSSPSFPLMASIDAARAYLENEGRARWEQAIHRAQALRHHLGGRAWTPKATLDPTRLVWRSRQPQALMDHLRRHGVEPEYADGAGVLLLVGPGVDPQGMELLGRLASQWPEDDQIPPAPPGLHPPLPARRNFAIPMGLALRAPRQRVPLALCANRVAADFVVPYPPGVPWLVPGEVVHSEVAEALQARWAQGQEVHGVLPPGSMEVVVEAGA
jgi:arginine decarboxylase